MSKVKIVGLALAAVFAFSAIAVANASALEWQINGKPITSATAVKSKGTLVLIDMGAKTQITCEGTDEGTVGPGAADSITKITATKCTQQEGSCETSKAITAKAIHLPWKTELVTVAGKTRDNVTSGGAGLPGYVVECTVLGFFKITDECTGNTNTGMKNVTGGVNAEFETVSNESPANCSVGGEKTGLVEGNDLNENPASGTLTTT